MSAVDPKDWNNILEKLAQGQLDNRYILDNISHLLNTTDLAYCIDNLGESLLFYAIVYQNEELRDYLLENTRYRDFPEKSKKKVKKSVYRGIKQLSYECDKNGSFLADTIQRIANSSFQSLLSDYVKEGHLAHIFTTVVPKDKKSSDFMLAVLNTLKEHALFAEDDEQYLDLKDEFDSVAKSCIWNQYGIRNFMKNESFSLTYLEYEFYHHAAEKGLYNQIEAFNLVKTPEFLLKKNSAGESAFLIFFKKAPFDFLQRHLKTLSQVLSCAPNKLDQINNRRQTFLHLLILNKKLSFEQKIQILEALDQNFNVEGYNKIADHCQMTPLVLFIYKYSKEIEKSIGSYRGVIDMLTPKVTLKSSKDQIEKTMGYIILRRMNLKPEKSLRKEFEDPNKEEFIYSQKLIKVCLDVKCETLLWALLDRNPSLNFDSLYSESVMTARHFVCIAAERNCKEVLKWFLDNKAGRAVGFISMKDYNGFQSLPEKSPFYTKKSKLRDYVNYSLLDEIINLVIDPSFSNLEERTKTLLLDIFEVVWDKLSSNERNKVLLNITFTWMFTQYEDKYYKNKTTRKVQKSTARDYSNKDLKDLKWFQFFIVKLYKSENTRLISLAKSAVSILLDEMVSNKVKRFLLFDALKEKQAVFVKDPELKPLVNTKKLEKERDLSYICSLILQNPDTLHYDEIYTPHLKEYFFTESFQRDLENTKLENEEKVLKALASFAVEWYLNKKWPEKNEEEEEKDRLFTKTVSLAIGSGCTGILYRLSCEIIRALYRTKKAADFIKKLEVFAESFSKSTLVGEFLSSSLYFYTKDQEENPGVEEVVRQLTQDNSYRPAKQLNLTARSLKEVERAGRVMLMLIHEPSLVSIVNSHQLLKKIKKEKTKSPEILYLPLFTGPNDDYLQSYALELCKTSKKYTEAIQGIYRKLLATWKLSRPYLLDYAIKTLDVKGVQSVLGSAIYAEEQILEKHSPLYTVLQVLERPKTSQDKQFRDSLNQIVHAILTSCSQENFKKLILHELTEKFRLIPIRDIYQVENFTSFDGNKHYPLQVYVKELYSRSPALIKEILPNLFELEEVPEWFNKHVFTFVNLLFTKDKFQLALDLFNFAPDAVSSNTKVVLDALEFCLNKEKSFIDPLLRFLIEQNITINVKAPIIQEMKVVDPKHYLQFLFSHDLPAQWTWALLQSDTNDLFPTLTKLKELNEEQFTKLCSNNDFAQALGVNGLHKKIGKLLELVKPLLKKSEYRDTIKNWAFAALESSSAVQELIMADKATSRPGKSQFNYPDLYHIIKLREELKTYGQREPLPTYFKFLGQEAEISKEYRDKWQKLNRNSHIGPLTERSLQAKFSKLKVTNVSKESKESEESTRAQRSNRPERKHNIYGYEPATGSSGSSESKPARKKVETKKPKTQEVKEIRNPLASRSLFQPEEKAWGRFNAKDERDYEKTTKILLDFLVELEEPKEYDEQWEQMLFKGIKADILAVEKPLTQYINNLAKTSKEQCSEFILNALKVFFAAVTASPEYRSTPKSRAYSTYQKQIEFIISFFSHLKKLHPEQKLANLLTRVIRLIHGLPKPEVPLAFCKALFEAFPNDTLEKNMGIPKNIVLGVFIEASIQRRDLTHFLSLMQLDPSLKMTNTVGYLIKQTDRICETETALPWNPRDLNQFGILETLFKRNLPKFVAEYDKLKGGSQLLSQIDCELDKSRKMLALKTITKPVWLHEAILEGWVDIVQGYLNKMTFTEKELDLAVVSANFEMFQTIVKKVFPNDPVKAVSYIRDNQILIKGVHINPSGEFALKIFNEYILSLKDQAPLDIKFFTETDEHGWSFISLIVAHRISRLFYLVMKYIKEVICQKQGIDFSAALSEIAQHYVPTSQENTEGGEGEKDLPLIIFAYKLRFYEFTSLMNQYKMSFGEIPEHIQRVAARFKLLLPENLSDSAQYEKFLQKAVVNKDADLSALYMASVKGYAKTVQLISKVTKNGFMNVTISLFEVIEELYFLDYHLNQGRIKEDLLSTSSFKVLQNLRLEPILASLHPQTVLDLVLRVENKELNPSIVVYALDKINEKIKDKNPWFNKLYERYLQEIRDSSTQTSKQVNVWERVWVDKDLQESIKSIVDITSTPKKQLDIEQLESRLDDDAIFKIAHKCSKKGNFFVLKALVLAYPKLFFTLPHEWEYENRETEEPVPDIIMDFWTKLAFEDKFMCDVLSSVDQISFESYVLQNVRDLLDREFLSTAESGGDSQLHNAKCLASCFLYIAFSFRGEQKDKENLSKEKLPELVRKVLDPFVGKQEYPSPANFNTVAYMVQSLLKFAYEKNLTHVKIDNIESHKPVLRKICGELLQRAESIILPGLNISTQKIENELQVCLDLITAQLKKEENPLVVYLSTLATALRFFGIIKDFSSYAETCKVSINLAFKECSSEPKSIGVRMEEVNDDELNITVGYTVKYDKEQKAFLFDCGDKTNYDIEQEIQSFSLIRQLRKIFEEAFNKAFDSNSPDSLPFSFNPASFEKAPLEEKTAIVNAASYLENALTTYFGVKPFMSEIKAFMGAENRAKLPSINENEDGTPPLVLEVTLDKQKKRFVLHEFYSFFFPQFYNGNIAYLPPAVLEEKLKKSTSLDHLIQAITFYENKIIELSKLNEAALKEVKIEGADWFIGGKALTSHIDSPYYDVLKVKKIIQIFRSKVSTFTKVDFSRFKWELSILSLLKDPISDVIKTVRNALSGSKDRSRKVLARYLEREDNALNTLENYLDCSVLRKIVNMLMHTFVLEAPQVTSSYHGYYIIFEKVAAPKKGSDNADPKTFHLFDRIIRYTRVKLEPVNKTLVLKLQYYVNELSAQQLEEYTRVEENSKDVIRNNPITQEYLDGLFSKYDIFTQLLPRKAFIDTIFDKKEVDDDLMQVSRSVSAKVNKQVTFTIDYDKLYRLCDSTIEKAETGARSESVKILSQLETKLAVFREFILRRVQRRIESTILSVDYMDQLLATIQMQNYTYRTKKPLSEYLKEEKFSYSIYPPQNADVVLTHDVSYMPECQSEQFVFLIQVDRSLAVSNAVPGQQYLIFMSSGIRYFQVKPSSPLPYHEDGVYLLMSATWPDLEFCSGQVNRVLILDGLSRIIDVTKSSLMNLIKDVQSDHPEDFRRVQPLLVNQDFRPENGVTVHNLFPLYPSLITLRLSGLEPPGKETELPSLKSLRSHAQASQLFDEHKVLDVSFINPTKVDITQLRPDGLKFSQRLRATVSFESTIHNFQSQISRLLKTLGVKEFADQHKLSLPQLSFGIDRDLESELTIPFEEFNEEIGALLDNVENVVEGVILPSKTQTGQVQELATTLYEDIYLENNIVAYRNILSLCKTVSEIHLFIAGNSTEQPIFFDKNTNSLRIFIQYKEIQGQCSLTYPTKEEIQAFLSQLLLREELKRTQEILNSQSQSTEGHIMSVISRVKQAIAPKIDVKFKFDLTQANSEQMFSCLLFTDITLWNIAFAIQFINLKDHKLLEGLRRVELQVLNDKSNEERFDFVKAAISSSGTEGKVLSLSLNIAHAQFASVLEAKELYISLCKQLGLTESPELITNSPFKPLDELTFSIEGHSMERRFEADIETLMSYSGKDNKEDAQRIPITTALLGIQDLKVYSCKNSGLENGTDDSRPNQKIIKIVVSNNMPPQNYYVMFVVNDTLLLKPLLANIFQRTESSPYKIVSDVMLKQQNIRENPEQLPTLIEDPFYLVGEVKNASKKWSSQKYFTQYLKFYVQDPNSGKNLDEMEQEGQQNVAKNIGLLPKFCRIRSKILDETRVYYKIMATDSCILRIKADESALSLPYSPDGSRINLRFYASAKVSLENTKVTAANGKEYRSDKASGSKKVGRSADPFADQYDYIFRNLCAAETVARTNIVVQDETVITEKDLDKKFIQDFQDTNVITNITKDCCFTFAGETRIEALQFRNKEGADAYVPSQDVLGYSAIFKHNRSTQIKFKGEIFEKNRGEFCVKWTPFIKGSYSLLINGRIVAAANNLMVLAGPSLDERSSFRWPKLHAYAFYDKIQFEAEFRDRYGNRLNQIEVEKHHLSEKTLDVKVSASDLKLDLKFEKVGRNGIQIGEITMSPAQLENVFANSDLTLTFLLHNKEIHSKIFSVIAANTVGLVFQVLGIGFRKRLDLFYNDVRNYRGNSSIKVSRVNFFKDLLELPLESFKTLTNVNFVNEPGIDAGGLRREFWELAGKEFKNSIYKVFSNLNDKYFLSYDYNLNGKTEKSFQLYGALLAGSILNRQLLGVNFATPFQKALFGNSFDLDDFKEVFGEQVSANYTMLLTMSKNDLESLDQYFVVNINNKQYELIPGGSDVQVTTENVKTYVEELVNFYFAKYHQRALVLIKEGFEKVFPFHELKKWFTYSELPLLTYGSLNVTGANILSVTKFSGGSEALVQFFKRFLDEADSDLLRNFLKFITGSSALPYDDPFYSLLVTFENRDSNKLPTSHTCSKHLEVPKYKSYEQMKKMLTIAFVHASEGFGFG